jgi:hypothetical protein
MKQERQKKTDGDVDGFFDDGTERRARGVQRFWSEVSEIVQNGMKAH